MSFGSAICSDMTNASTAETFSVSFTLPYSFAFAWIRTRVSEHLLAVPDFQVMQFSIVTFHRFVTTGMLTAVFVAQISSHHWSKTMGTTVDDCHDVSLHLRIVREQMLLCCQLLFNFCGAHREKNSQSHVFRQLVSCAFSVALFQDVPRLGWCVRGRLF